MAPQAAQLRASAQPDPLGASGAAPAYLTARAILRTARLVLRPLAHWDEGAFLGAVNACRADLDAFCPVHRAGESDSQMFERHLSMAAAAAVTGKAVRLVITPAGAPTRILGAANLNDVTRGLESRATANWWLVPAARRRGIAHEGVAALLEHALDDLPVGRGLDRVDALIEPANFPSLRLAERLRMRAQPGRYERVAIGGEERVHQMYSAFARLPALAASMVEIKPLRGLEAILRWTVAR